MTIAGPVARKCRRHQWAISLLDVALGEVQPVRCLNCDRPRDPIRSARGKQARNYGNRAELDVARRYGGTKVGHHGGPVDVVGADFDTQVKTHRRKPPLEWTAAFAGLAADKTRLPRLLLRFVHTGGPSDYIVIPAAAWLEWYGKDEEEETS